MAVEGKRLESVWIGRDAGLLDAMFDFYAPTARNIVDVCCNQRRMWKGSNWGERVRYYDADPAMMPNLVASWDALPDEDSTVDVLVYDPPHLPLAAVSPKSLATESLQHFGTGFGLTRSCGGDNISSLHPPFLKEALRVLKPDGLIFAKIKDYVHNHRYQWNSAMFCEAVRAAGLCPCDVVVKRDPCAGNLKSGRWEKQHHARNVHCYWVVVRKGRCEPRR